MTLFWFYNFKVPKNPKKGIIVINIWDRNMCSSAKYLYRYEHSDIFTAVKYQDVWGKTSIFTSAQCLRQMRCKLHLQLSTILQFIHLRSSSLLNRKFKSGKLNFVKLCIASFITTNEPLSSFSVLIVTTVLKGLVVGGGGGLI